MACAKEITLFDNRVEEMLPEMTMEIVEGWASKQIRRRADEFCHGCPLTAPCDGMRLPSDHPPSSFTIGRLAFDRPPSDRHQKYYSSS
jgi:hypothetical protein